MSIEALRAILQGSNVRSLSLRFTDYILHKAKHSRYNQVSSVLHHESYIPVEEPGSRQPCDMALYMNAYSFDDYVHVLLLLYVWTTWHAQTRVIDRDERGYPTRMRKR